MLSVRLLKKYLFGRDLAAYLLLELLVVIGLFAIIAPLVAQIIVTSLNASKWATANGTAWELAEASAKTTENIAFSRWEDIYGQNKGANYYYYSLPSAGAWSISSGQENIDINQQNYIRYFQISDVCRDDATGNLSAATDTPPCVSGSSDDPSTQKISITVSWADGSVNKNIYLTRWRNQVCNQNAWSVVSPAPQNCPSDVYGSLSNIDINTVPGSLILTAE